MQIKNGVRFSSGQQAMAVASQVIEGVYLDHAAECVITGGSEGRRPNTLPHRGWALDFRLNHISWTLATRIVTHVRDHLGDGFDVVAHGDGPSFHLHVEYDPKEETD